AVALARQHPALDIGLHLNITNKPFSFAFKGAGTDLERQIRQQIETAVRTGLNISHIDGHKHVHVIPRVLSMLRRIAPAYGIRGLRTMPSRTPQLRSLLRANPAWRVPIVKQYMFAVGARWVWRLSGPGRAGKTAGPDYFYGIAETGFLDLAVFSNIIRDL